MDTRLARIPYADQNKVGNLPVEAKTILGYAKNVMPIGIYKALEHQFVDIAEQNETKPVLNEKTMYGGKLQLYTLSFINDLGYYNPNRIPIDILDKMSKDPTIALGLNVIVCTISGLNWRIESRSELQRLFLSKTIKKIYRDTVLGLSDAVRLGTAIGEKVWDYVEIKIYSDKKGRRLLYDDSVYIYKKIKFINPKTLRMRLTQKGEYNGIIQQINGEFIPVKSGKTVIYPHNMKFGNYYGDSRLENCYPPWYWSQILTQFVLRYYERKGQPLTVVRAPPGTRTDSNNNKVDNLAYALKIGQGAVSNSVVALPVEFDKSSNKELWSIEVVKDDQRGEMFMDILNYMDSRKLRGLFIPDKMGLASDGSPHSASGSSAGDSLDVFIMTEQSLANDIENIFDTQIIPQLLYYNFDKEEIEEASIKIEKLDYNRKLLMKDVMLRLIMLAGSGVRDGRIPKVLPSLKNLATMLDLPVESFSDAFDDIVPTTQNVAVPTPDQNGKNKVNVQNSPMPTLEKKNIQDSNNANRSAPRKERSTRDRSIREKR